jgi:hypothetical protein
MHSRAIVLAALLTLSIATSAQTLDPDKTDFTTKTYTGVTVEQAREAIAHGAAAFCRPYGNSRPYSNQARIKINPKESRIEVFLNVSSDSPQGSASLQDFQPLGHNSTARASPRRASLS